MPSPYKRQLVVWKSHLCHWIYHIRYSTTNFNLATRPQHDTTCILFQVTNPDLYLDPCHVSIAVLIDRYMLDFMTSSSSLTSYFSCAHHGVSRSWLWGHLSATNLKRRIKSPRECNKDNSVVKIFRKQRWIGRWRWRFHHLVPQWWIRLPNVWF